MPDPIKVLIVEDSPTIAQILVALIKTDPQLSLIGLASDGAEAIRLVARYRPHVITMDVNMPNMGGLEATEYVMAHYPTPILVLTASLARQDINLSFKMLSAGALEIIEKPHGDGWERESRRLLERIKLLSRVKVITHIRGKARYPTKLSPDTAVTVNSVSDTKVSPPLISINQARPNPRRGIRSDGVTAPLDPSKIVKPVLPTTAAEIAALKAKKLRVVGVAASTGGPPALSKLLRLLPPNFSVPLILVQHIPAGFSAGLADWLNGETELTVKLAIEGELLQPGFAYLPADDRHLMVRGDMRLHLDDSAPRFGLRPSADVTFESMAQAFPGKSLSVILTGMGRDGSLGMKALAATGSYNIAQDEASSVIFGMPKSAIDLGVVDKVMPLGEIPHLLKSVFMA